MTEAFSDLLDDLHEHIERELTRVPPAVAQALLHTDTPLSTMELLRRLARPGRGFADLGPRRLAATGEHFEGLHGHDGGEVGAAESAGANR
jgi:hypothetical protein